MVSKTKIIITAGLGLLGAIIGTIVAVFLPSALIPTMPDIIKTPLMAWVMLIFFGGFSLIEVPVMIYGLRNILASDKPATINLGLFTNAVFILFAMVYALPNLLLAADPFIWMGFLLSSLAFVRFGCSVIFLPGSPKPLEETVDERR